ncbi:nicotinamide mononucleotide transporter [Catalinimonas alkaloidigena]|uniref:Nicotinamide riboside transporter PnuC n=1 Tax=Catalinimonas alkaloidigena TaxID=1075417 RepID=A0A1G9GIG9_9BACT|nr:nicotinamide riboside transporter PnuC [Catalinimonas alkaloidigena]SDL00474.1 nicotinamide mononucleotide transporter [Catalinimonas alkaloidigena]
MELLNTLTDVQAPLVDVWGYPLSFIELVGTVTGLVSVVYAARAQVLTWPFGVVNVLAFMIIFYQVHLYSDMLLQVYFLTVTLYGWQQWQKKKADSVRIAWLSARQQALAGAMVVGGTLLLGAAMQRVHVWLPQWFVQPAAYPWADAFTTSASVVATVLLARKRLEAWVLWVLVDAVSCVLYFQKEIRLMALEYVIFLLIALYGGVQWYLMLHDETRVRFR